MRRGLPFQRCRANVYGQIDESARCVEEGLTAQETMYLMVDRLERATQTRDEVEVRQHMAMIGGLATRYLEAH
ncbi:MAG: hypothetical protein JST51_01570 [Armatimonadetes bacterium]|nr:hypothetical protein [Armatimonadota bacterium]